MASYTGHSDIDQVRQATDLVALVGEHVALRPKGREHMGLCPFHDDHTPSLAVVTHKGNAFYKCHSCGAAGDCFDFVMEFHKMDFPEALRYLAGRAGVALRPREQSRPRAADGESSELSGTDLRNANAFAADFFRAVLRHPGAGALGRDILNRRGISDAMTEEFQLGLAPDRWDGLLKLITDRGLNPAAFHAAGLLKRRDDGGAYDAFRNRVIFPICDALGHPIAFGARQIDPEDQPKYLNSAESQIFHKSRTLYGLHLAKRAIIDSRHVIVTEGYTDVIACHQAGIRNVVATLGTALTPEHASALKRLCETVILLFDGDAAGQRAADRALEVFFSQSIDVRICVLLDQLDPDELLRQSGGREILERAFAAAEDALQFRTARFLAELREATTPTARAVRLEAFLDDLVRLGFVRLQGPRKRLVCVQLADALQLPLRDLESALAEAQARQPRRAASSASPGSALRTSAPNTDSPDSAAASTRDGNAGATESAELPRSRRIAERDLLAMLVFEPSLLSCPVRTREGSLSPLHGVHDVGHFADPLCRRVFELLLAATTAGDEWSTQQLLDAIDDRACRQFISGLYLDAARLCGEDRTEWLERLQAVSDALLALLRRRDYEHNLAAARACGTADAQPALNDILELRRRIGAHAVALPRGVRS